MARHTKMPFELRVFSVVRNFHEYGWYAEDERKAIATLRRHHPEKSKAACAEAFASYLAAYRDAVQRIYRDPTLAQLAPDSPERTQFAREHPDVPRKMIDSILAWVHHWHCER